MRPKYKVYSFRLLASSLTGLLNGLLKADPSLGILAFILAYFLVTPISLRIWRDELKDLGLMALYKEAIGASLLALILTWSLAMSFTGQGIVIYAVRANQSGVHPIETLDGKILPPGNEELFGYNSVLLNFSNGVLKGAKLGICFEGSSDFTSRMGDYDLKLTQSEVSVSVEVDPRSSEGRELLSKLFGDLKVYRNGTLVLGNISISPGSFKELKKGASNVSLRYVGPHLILELRSDLKTGLQEFPLNTMISEIRRESSKLCVFDARDPKTGRRSLNVRERYYLVVMREG